MATSTDTTHTGSDYYVSETGTIQQQSNAIAAIALKAAGYSGPYDWTEAKSVANDVVERIGLGEVNATTGATTGESTTAASTTASTLPTFGFSWSGAKNFAIRFAEVVCGAVLIIVALAKITGVEQKLPAVLSKIPV